MYHMIYLPVLLGSFLVDILKFWGVSCGVTMMRICVCQAFVSGKRTRRAEGRRRASFRVKISYIERDLFWGGGGERETWQTLSGERTRC